ncbi:substrate-binding periplasmic protein [Halopseudomonas salegens]|nr:transporter substrate-binding domain-containing protein [Halopseudomonas salegens]
MTTAPRRWPLLRVVAPLTVCALLWAATSLAVADETRQLRAAYIHFPPMAWTDEQGQPAGYMIELTNRLAADSGYQLQWTEYPIKRIRLHLEQGQIDLWPGSAALPALEPITVETQLDLTVTLCAYYLDGTPPIEQLDDLKQGRLILIHGYTYRELLGEVLADNPNRPLSAPNERAALELLARGRGDYLLNFTHPLETALRDFPVDDLQCTVLDEWPIAYIVSRQTPDAQEIVDKLEQAYKRHQITAARNHQQPDITNKDP